MSSVRNITLLDSSLEGDGSPNPQVLGDFSVKFRQALTAIARVWLEQMRRKPLSSAAQSPQAKMRKPLAGDREKKEAVEIILNCPS
ncbi:MAG: hypothetical protein AAFY57_18540 [Cyanobacteria bacterium J06642_2]